MNREANIFATYFDSNISFLKLTAYWFYDEKNKTIKQYLQHVYNIAWYTYIFIIYMPSELLYTFYVIGDLNRFLRSLRDFGNHISLLYKTINYLIRRKDLMNLVQTLQYGNYQYEEYEDFKPKLIIDKEKREAVRWTNYFFYFCNAICLCMFLTGICTFFFLGDRQYIIKDGEKYYDQLQPVYIVSPFGAGTRIKFLVTFLHTVLCLTTYAWMIVALDSLYITLMSCISAHLKILEGAFKTLRARCLRRLKIDEKFAENILHDPEELQNEVNNEMVKCVQHLQTVLRVAEKVESIYNIQTLFQTLVSLGEMCFSLYLLSETFDQNVGQEFTYLIATGFELLLYCWFGNRITEAVPISKSIQVSYSLYDSDWFSTNLSFRKQVIFTMTRMKRPIYVTIGKITPLTFNTFLTMTRGAYSFFTFLKQRHGIRQT